MLRQVVGDSPGKKNVAGIATIHDSLRNIDPGSSDIRSIVHITAFITGPQQCPCARPRMLSQFAADFLRARTGASTLERTPVSFHTGRQSIRYARLGARNAQYGPAIQN
jgi:hypothetical protein